MFRYVTRALKVKILETVVPVSDQLIKEVKRFDWARVDVC